MRYRWIDNIEEFKQTAAEWDKALLDSGDYNPFLLSDFIMTWWKHFGTGRKLRIFTVYDDGRIAGGIPLYLAERGLNPLGFNVLHYIGDAAANYTEPFYRAAETPVFTLLEEAITECGEIDALSLPNVRGENGILREIRSASRGKGSIRYAPQDHFNFAIDLSSGKEAYFSGLSNELRTGLRRKRKRAVRDYGEVKLRRAGEEGELRSYLDHHVKYSIDAFRGRGRRNIIEDERYRSFFDELFTLMGEKGRMDVYALYAGTSLIAVMLFYRFGKGFNWVFNSFDYDFRNVGPGYLLMEEVIYEILRQGESLCNCYGHESFFKKQWCNLQTPMYRVFTAKRSVRGSLYIFTQKIIGTLRANKAVVSAARRIRKA